MAVIGAGLLATALTRGVRLARRLAPARLAALSSSPSRRLRLVTGQVGAELRTTRLLTSPGDQTRRISEELASAAAAMRETSRAIGMEAADYLHRCTRPTDRVLIVGYEPDVFVFSERLVRGGTRDHLRPSFYDDDRYSRDAIARLETESVPIVLAEPETFYATFPRLLDYLRTAIRRGRRRESQ